MDILPKEDGEYIGAVIAISRAVCGGGGSGLKV